MDAQAKKKALYRAKLNAQKQEKRIESPLVRYNENDHPVCRVCDVVLKSDSLWLAHQASRKHHEAVKNVKANAAEVTRVNNLKLKSSVELPKPKDKHEHSLESHNNKPEPSTTLPRTRQASQLPSDFFDNHEKRQKSGIDVAKSENHESHKKARGSAQTQRMEVLDSRNESDGLPSVGVVETKNDKIQPPRENAHTNLVDGSKTKQAKGAVPEGFFDDKDADLRARGITPVKLDVKDEYKEFEKLIQEDLQEVDKRLEEEEYDAADMIEEAESVEQRTYRERVERLKRKKMELKAAKTTIYGTGPQLASKEDTHLDSSSDDDSDDNFTVDWRAKHL